MATSNTFPDITVTTTKFQEKLSEILDNIGDNTDMFRDVYCKIVDLCQETNQSLDGVWKESFGNLIGRKSTRERIPLPVVFFPKDKDASIIHGGTFDEVLKGYLIRK